MSRQNKINVSIGKIHKIRLERIAEAENKTLTIAVKTIVANFCENSTLREDYAFVLKQEEKKILNEINKNKDIARVANINCIVGSATKARFVNIVSARSMQPHLMMRYMIDFYYCRLAAKGILSRYFEIIEPSNAKTKDLFSDN